MSLTRPRSPLVPNASATGVYSRNAAVGLMGTSGMWRGSFLRASVLIEPAEELADAAHGERYRGVCCAVVQVDPVAVGAERVAAREDHVVHIPLAFVRRLMAQNPRVTPEEAARRIVQCKEREGDVNNVIFPCGYTLGKITLFT